MLQLDHLVIVAPSLELGAAHVREQLGIAMSTGGKHTRMGTHNLLLRLGEAVYLEVIAVDPAAPRPEAPRWFGLDDAEAVQSAWDDGRRLRTWVARTDDLDALLLRHGDLLGQKTRQTRGDMSWLFAVRPDGLLPADGVAPSAMDWEGRAGPARTMPNLGASLISFRIEHPKPEGVSELYSRLQAHGAPEIRKGGKFRYLAMIETPGGIKELH
jgi:hypothetical protein